MLIEGALRHLTVIRPLRTKGFVLIRTLMCCITCSSRCEVRSQPVPEPKWRIKEMFVPL